MRFAQIGLGAIAIIISLIVLTYPGLSTISLVHFLSILFFIVGIEKIITGIFFKSKSRFASISLGILVLILSGLALAFPVGTTYILVLLVGFALLFDGIARIAYGIGEKSESKFNRFFSIGVGIHFYRYITIYIGFTSIWFCICRISNRNSNFNNWNSNINCRIKRTKSRNRTNKYGYWKIK